MTGELTDTDFTRMAMEVLRWMVSLELSYTLNWSFPVKTPKLKKRPVLSDWLFSTNADLTVSSYYTGVIMQRLKEYFHTETQKKKKK